MGRRDKSGKEWGPHIPALLVCTELSFPIGRRNEAKASHKHCALSLVALVVTTGTGKAAI